jgi:hypothetical protein
VRTVVLVEQRFDGRRRSWSPRFAPMAAAPEEPDAAEIAHELLLDLRAELPRLDARAAAGTALTGAVLVAVMTQRLPASVHVFRVVAVVALTLALVTFLAALLPGGRADLRGVGRSDAERVEALRSYLQRATRTEYYVTAVSGLQGQVRSKAFLLRVALVLGLLGILTLAAGASYALLIGLR